MKAPEGYVLSSNQYIVPIEVKDQKTIQYTYEIELSNQKTKVQISKQDITNAQEIEGAHLIVFEKDMEEQAIELSMYYRKEGKPATMLFAEDGLYHMEKTVYEEYAKRHHIAQTIYLCKEI